jgi:PAS domain S-box-containing protein
MFDTDFNFANLGECIWNGQENGFRIGIVGSGAGFSVILDTIHSEPFRNFLPDLSLVALSELKQSPAMMPVPDLGVPVYDTFDQMLEAHPEMNLVVELVGDDDRLGEIRSKLDNSISLLDHREAIFFCGFYDMALTKHHFRVSFENQRVLLQSIIDEIREDIMLLSREGRIEDANKRVWQRAGKTREEILGHFCWQCATSRGGRQFCASLDPTCPFHRTLHTGTKDEAMFTRLDENGHLLYYRIYSYPIYDSRGNMTHILMMHRDITERTYQERHEQQRDRLAVIGEMSTYLAHEIRNPLFAIGGFANSLLKSTNLTEHEREKVSILVSETKRLDHILSSMLNFTKPSKSTLEEVDLCKLMTETVDLMSIGYEKHGYEFTTECNGKVPCVQGNAGMFKQCLVNIIKNAFEAMPDGGIISLKLDMRGDMAALSVSDTGVGMTSREQEKVFSPFYSTKEDGYGLGLAMIRKIITDYDGRIEIASKPGQGTTVTMLFCPVLGSCELPALQDDS